MKFYKRDIPGLYLPGTIWNPDRGRQWCSFDENGGAVETNDPKLIEILLGFGFPNDGAEAVKEPEIVEPDLVEAELTRADIEEAAEELMEEVVIKEGDILETEAQTTDTKATPIYKTKTELSVMTKAELKVYALETFGIQIDIRHNWTQLQREVGLMGAALEE